MWGEPRRQMRLWSADYHVKLNNIQSESELTKDGSITNTVMAQHKSIWTAEMEDQLVNFWQKQESLYNVSCKKYLFSSLERFCKISRVHSQDSCLKVCWGAIFVTSRHTTHYRSKTVTSRICCPHVCGLLNF